MKYLYLYLYKYAAVETFYLKFKKKEYLTSNNQLTRYTCMVGYEPADLTVHPPPKTIEGGFIFFV